MFYLFACSLIFISIDQLSCETVVGAPNPISIEDFKNSKYAQIAFREAINKYNGEVKGEFSYAPYHIHEITGQVIIIIIIFTYVEYIVI